MTTPVPPEAVTNAAVAVYQVLSRWSPHLEQAHGAGWMRRLADEAAAETMTAAASLIAAAERDRIKADRGVSACCGAGYHREPGTYGRWECHSCGRQCDLIGVIA